MCIKRDRACNAFHDSFRSRGDVSFWCDVASLLKRRASPSFAERVKATRMRVTTQMTIIVVLVLAYQDPELCIWRQPCSGLLEVVT